MNTIVYHNRWHRVKKTIPWNQIQKQIHFRFSGYAEAIEQAYKYQSVLPFLSNDPDKIQQFEKDYQACDWLILDLIGKFEYELQETGQWNKPERLDDDLDRGAIIVPDLVEEVEAK
jgi:hypothetical protein